MKARVNREEETEREREIFHQLIHCLDDCHGKNWAKLKPRVSSRFLSQEVGAQTLNDPPLVCPGHYQGAALEAELQGHKPAPM